MISLLNQHMHTHALTEDTILGQDMEKLKVNTVNSNCNQISPVD